MLFWHSVRHTLPRQLAHRLRLMAKRRAMERVGPHVGSLLREALPCAADLPRPLFAPRQRYVKQAGGEPRLVYLGREEGLDPPKEWHPPELEYGTRLEKLTLHYMEYLEAVDDGRFAGLVEDWIDHNPPYRRGYWLDNWNSYALSIRCVVWMQQFALRGDSLVPRVRRKLLWSLARQIDFLSRNLEVDLEGNHLVKNIKALLWAGRFFEGVRARSWQRLGMQLLSRQLSEQVLPDGMHFERSPAYHAQVFSDLLECLHVLPEDVAARALLEASLSEMAQALADLTHPDGLVALFNDGGLHMAYSPEECMGVYQRLTGQEVQPSDRFALPHAGYYGLRSDVQYLLADFGPIAPDHMPGHGQGDIFSFEWDVDGRRFIVGTGVSEYHAGHWRDYARSTASHNTVTIADEDQCEFYGAFRVGRRARVHVDEAEMENEWRVAGWHDGYRRLEGRPVHHRRICADARGLRVEDRVDGSGGHEVRARLLLHPECEWTVDGAGVELARGGARARLETDTPVRAIRAWWMPDFGKRVATTQLVMEYGRVPCAGGFRLSVVSQE